MSITESLRTYMSENEITCEDLSEQTGIDKNILYKSFYGTRELRADEFLSICTVLKIDPMRFVK